MKTAKVMGMGLAIALSPTLSACGDEVEAGWAGTPIAKSARGVAANATDVTGAGQWTTAGGGRRSFNVSVRADASGAVSGHNTINNRDQAARLRIDVDCLEVFGNVAVMSGVVVRSTDPQFSGQTRFFAVESNGPGQTDRATEAFQLEAPDACKLVGPPPDPFLISLTQGNIRIR